MIFRQGAGIGRVEASRRSRFLFLLSFLSLPFSFSFSFLAQPVYPVLSVGVKREPKDTVDRSNLSSGSTSRHSPRVHSPFYYPLRSRTRRIYTLISQANELTRRYGARLINELEESARLPCN